MTYWVILAMERLGQVWNVVHTPQSVGKLLLLKVTSCQKCLAAGMLAPGIELHFTEGTQA